MGFESIEGVTWVCLWSIFSVNLSDRMELLHYPTRCGHCHSRELAQNSGHVSMRESGGSELMSNWMTQAEQDLLPMVRCPDHHFTKNSHVISVKYTVIDKNICVIHLDIECSVKFLIAIYSFHDFWIVIIQRFLSRTSKLLTQKSTSHFWTRMLRYFGTCYSNYASKGY